MILLEVGRFAIKRFPLSCRGKGFEVLKGTAVHADQRSTNNPAEIQKRFFIDLILAEKVRVVAQSRVGTSSISVALLGADVTMEVTGYEVRVV